MVRFKPKTPQKPRIQHYFKLQFNSKSLSMGIEFETPSTKACSIPPTIFSNNINTWKQNWKGIAPHVYLVARTWKQEAK